MITSIQNDRVRLAHALQTQAKARRKEGRIALEGARLVGDAYEHAGSRPDFVLYDPATADPALINLLDRQRVTLLSVSAEVMRYVSDTEQPQGVVAVFPTPAVTLPDAPTRILILDDIRDPGNMGTMLRTAAAAGVDVVLSSPGTVDLYNPKVLRAGMGAHFRVALAERSWADIAAYCTHAQVVLAAMQGELTYDRIDWTRAWALIIGSEAHGASPDAQRLTKRRAYIPMSADAESLNAAAAAAVFLFEAQRQVRTKA